MADAARPASLPPPLFPLLPPLSCGGRAGVCRQLSALLFIFISAVLVAPSPFQFFFLTPAAAPGTIAPDVAVAVCCVSVPSLLVFHPLVDPALAFVA